MKKNAPFLDLGFFLPILSLLFFGLLFLLSASAHYGWLHLNDAYYFVKRQTGWALLGIFLLWMGWRVNYKLWLKLSPFIYFLTIFLLFLTFVPGIRRGRGEVYRWIGWGGVSLQPSEFAKLGIVFYLVYFLSKKKEKVKKFVQGFLPSLLIIGLPSLLILKEPDFGTAVLVASLGLILLFISGARVKHFLFLLIFLPLIWLEISRVPYRWSRILAFLNPEASPLEKGYHNLHLEIALGSGGLIGLGPGAGKEKLFYLPTPHTDSIFSVIGEELGFVGTTLVLSLFFFFTLRGLLLINSLPEREGRLLDVGIVSFILLSVMINFGVCTGTLPVTGTPLPFISYGGSSLLTSLFGVGVLLNLSRQRWK